ncbi:sulfite exporter TauE/SafE family protein [Acetobacteraceae bacterium H6797]|nr:sulfite exporter TauE/SafE family protein [Acetobacteraceae bacterium H6797]
MAIAIFATIIAGLMRGYSGFGTAILLSPVYSTLWEPKAGVPIMLAMELFVSIQLVPRAFREADRRVILPIGLAASIATPIGAYVLLAADGGVLRRCIGAMVLVFGLLLMSGWRYHGSRPRAVNVAVGLVSGLMKGSTGMSGPPVILYLLAGPEDAARHRANLILFFGIISVISIVAPLLAGLYDAVALMRGAVLLPVLMVCVPVGARLFHILPVRWYKRLALVFLVSAGAFALFG